MSTRGRTIRLGTRGSALAMRQAVTVRDALTSRRRDVELVTVETTGDELREERIQDLGTTGAFVRALDDEVLDGDLDAAVHSMKDVPTEMPDDLVVAGVPERASPRDVLVSPGGASIASLPDGATVGTSSLRRGAQLLAARPDLAVEPLRGNVDTRVEKLLAPGLQREHQRRLAAQDATDRDEPAANRHGDEATDDADDPADERRADAGGESDDGVTAEDAQTGGEADGADPTFDRSVDAWFDDLAEIERRALERVPDVEYDAIVLAEAGLQRIGLLHHVDHERLSPEQFVPAPGQGALAVTATDEDVTEEIRRALDHPPTRVETTAERALLSALGGGCIAPIGVHAVLQGPVVGVTVRVLARDGAEEIRRTRELPVERYRPAAREFAADLADLGAADLVAEARRGADADPARDANGEGGP